MKNKKNLIIGGLLIVAATADVWRIVGARASSDSGRQLTPIVQVERPHRETIYYRLKFNGDVTPMQQANIYSKVNGNLERIFVDIGMKVSQNQLLALIDTAELSQQVQQTGATFQNAKINFERTKELSDQNLIAKQELDNADATMKVARANYETAATRLGYAKITAPFPGFITKRFLDRGANVKSNDATLFVLMEIDAMKIMINVLEKDIPLIAKGKKAVITVDAYPGKQFFGSVTRLSEAVDLSTRTMAVEIDIPNGDHYLKPGMFANVTLLVDEHKNALTIPTPALLKDEKGNFVFAVDGRIARRHYITFGGEQNARTEILSGLLDEDTVIFTGQQFVRDGGQVTIQP